MLNTTANRGCEIPHFAGCDDVGNTYLIISLKGKTTKNTLTLEEQEEARLQAEREREEEERLLELKNEEYELLDEDSLQVHQKMFPVFHVPFAAIFASFFCRTSK